MSKETIVIIGFCLFAFLIGLRLKHYFGEKKLPQEAKPMNKNQRSKMAREEPTVSSRPGWRNRKKTIRFFTILALILVVGLLVYMIPALVRDVQRSESVDVTNLFLRVLIFVLGVWIFVTGYLKLAKQRKDERKSE